MGLRVFENNMCFYLIVLLVYSVKCETSDPVVTVCQGQLRGSVETLLDGSPYYSFKGIPYASPPTRFAPTEPPKPWEGVYDATKHGAECTQLEGNLKGEENCLFLNVYTKSLAQGAKIPVMVYIHGGSFKSGSGNDETLGPLWILQHDNIILVKINYRLDVFGFLSLDIPEAPGNVGLRDQAAALKWVHENIAQFGGDPNKVTIFGQSAGGVSVAYHIQSPMSKGLFQQAISQSGVSITGWGLDRESSDKPFKVAMALGNTSTDKKEVLSFLKNVTGPALIDAAKIVIFGPVVEKKLVGVEPFISEDPVDALVSGRVNHVPLIVGCTSDELLLLASLPIFKLNDYTDNTTKLIPEQVLNKATDKQKEEFGERAKAFVMKMKDSNMEDVEVISKLFSDVPFTFETHRYAYFFSKLAKTYLYRFSCSTELNIFKKSLNITAPGATHTDDVYHLFNSIYTNDIYKENAKVRDLVYKFTKLWTDFAKTGDPTPDDFQGVKWPVYNATNAASLEINEKAFTAGESVDKSRMDLWNQMYCEVGLLCMN